MKRLFRIKHSKGNKHLKKLGVCLEFSNKTEAKLERDRINKEHKERVYVSYGRDHWKYNG